MNDVKQSDLDQPSPWVEVLLKQLAQECEPSVAFEARCVKSAQRVAGVSSLRKSINRLGFWPRPLIEYLRQAAYMAGETLTPVFSFAGLSSLPETNRFDDAVPAAVRLAVLLGIPLDHLLIYLRLDLLAKTQGDARLTRVRQSGGGTMLPGQARDLLNAIEQSLGAPVVQSSTALQAQARDLYRQQIDREADEIQ